MHIFKYLFLFLLLLGWNAVLRNSFLNFIAVFVYFNQDLTDISAHFRMVQFYIVARVAQSV